MSAGDIVSASFRTLGVVVLYWQGKVSAEMLGKYGGLAPNSGCQTWAWEAFGSNSCPQIIAARIATLQGFLPPGRWDHEWRLAAAWGRLPALTTA